MELTGRNVVITGAAGGIGAALAHRFAAGGANVLLADIQDPSPVAAAIPGAHAVVADVATEDGNRLLIEQARATLGGIDLFCANAGVAVGRDLDEPEAVWELALNVNVNAHRWAAKHLLPDWLERGEGYFLSTASAAGLLAQIGSFAYTVTKRAAVAFAEWLSITYGDRGVRVSCLCPQGVDTDMLDADIGLGTAVVRAAGAVLSPAAVAEAVADGIAAERFLILPHPEVQRYAAVKATDHERWLAGMRRLQATVASAQSPHPIRSAP